MRRSLRGDQGYLKRPFDLGPFGFARYEFTTRMWASFSNCGAKGNYFFVFFCWLIDCMWRRGSGQSTCQNPQSRLVFAKWNPSLTRRSRYNPFCIATSPHIVAKGVVLHLTGTEQLSPSLTAPTVVKNVFCHSDSWLSRGPV